MNKIFMKGMMMGGIGHHHSYIKPAGNGIVMEKPVIVHGVDGNQSEYRTNTNPSQNISESKGDGAKINEPIFM